MITTESVTETDRSAILAGLDRWLAAYHARDSAALVADVAADVMVFPPNQSGVKGVAALREWHDDQMKLAEITFDTVKTEEVMGTSSLAVQRFSFAIRVQPRAGGAAIEDRGMCVWVWRCESGGKWLLTRAIWNSSNPLPV